MAIKTSNDQANSDNAHILILRGGKSRFIAVPDDGVSASLSHFSIMTREVAGALTAEYGTSLSPRDEPYEFDFPRDPDKHRGTIDYRDENGLYFIMPTSGKFFVLSKRADLPNTYMHYITYINLTFKNEEHEVTINGTGEATFTWPSQ